jgi:hypothetical protein
MSKSGARGWNKSNGRWEHGQEWCGACGNGQQNEGKSTVSDTQNMPAIPHDNTDCYTVEQFARMIVATIEIEERQGFLNSFAHAASEEGFFHRVGDAVLQIEHEKGEYPRP